LGILWFGICFGICLLEFGALLTGVLRRSLSATSSE